MKYFYCMDVRLARSKCTPNYLKFDNTHKKNNKEEKLTYA